MDRYSNLDSRSSDLLSHCLFLVVSLFAPVKGAIHEIK